MPSQTIDALVYSPNKLVRELLAALLRSRSGVRVGHCESLEQCAAASPSARMLVCDTSAMSAPDFASFAGRLEDSRPGLRLIRIDGSAGSADFEAFVVELRSARPAGPLPHDSLTPLETRVMLAVAAGLRTSDIARRMRRSGKTVEKHRANALRKIGVRNVAQLTAYAIRHRLLDEETILPFRSG